jgi:hypothetical protein
MPRNIHEKSEREAWKETYAPRNAYKRRRWDRTFKRLFPKGHNTSLRPSVRRWAKPKVQLCFFRRRHMKNLCQLHPRAFKLIAQYGIDYKPMRWREPPGDPRPRQCFWNSWQLVRTWHKLTDEGREGLLDGPPQYVEGIVIGVLTSPMLHAWNAYGLGSKDALDFTCYAGSDWNRYLGIPFTREEYQALCGNRTVSLFHRKCFPHVEAQLKKLLAKRAREAKNGAA